MEYLILHEYYIHTISKCIFVFVYIFYFWLIMNKMYFIVAYFDVTC